MERLFYPTHDPLVVSYGSTADLAEAEATAADRAAYGEAEDNPQGYVTATLEARAGTRARRT